MNDYFFSFQSLTQAHEAKRSLKQQGIEAEIVNTPLSHSAGGCGYSVKVSGSDAQAASLHLKGVKLPFQKIFVSRGNIDRR